jgi:hypothetical protein
MTRVNNVFSGRWFGVLLFVAFLLLWALLTKVHTHSWQEESRMATVQTLVEQGTFIIDRTEFNRTGDKVFVDGHLFRQDACPVGGGGGVYAILHNAFASHPIRRSACLVKTLRPVAPSPRRVRVSRLSTGSLIFVADRLHCGGAVLARDVDDRCTWYVGDGAGCGLRSGFASRTVFHSVCGSCPGGLVFVCGVHTIVPGASFRAPLGRDTYFRGRHYARSARRFEEPSTHRTALRAARCKCHCVPLRMLSERHGRQRLEIFLGRVPD